MLEHQKIILQNVIDYPKLFYKELEKSKVWLKPEEFKKLCNWLESEFSDRIPKNYYFFKLTHESEKMDLAS